MDDATRDDHVVLELLYPSLRRFAAVVAPAEVGPDDLVQEALARALRGGPLTRIAHPEAYIRRVMVNLAANERRRLGRQRRVLRLLAAQPEDEVVAAYPTDLVALRRLSANERAVLYLHEVEGRPFAEIADQLGQREPAVRKTASRARARLRLQEERRP